MRPLLAVLALAACAPRVPEAVRDACRAAAVRPEALRDDVTELATGFAPRDFDHPENLDRAAAWIAGRLRAAGARVSEQPYEVDGRTYRNVLAEVGPPGGAAVVVGAHYDTAGDQPGADDNASGVAALLALAPLLAADPPAVRVILAAYTLEEPPAFATPRMGSAVHARALAAAGDDVRLMIAVEMIGAFADAPGSQRYPPLAGLFRPSAGNFVAVVGKWGQGDAVRGVAAALRGASELPVETLSAPRAIQGVDFSDHRSFWDAGFRAVMVTDTAFFRNDRYHTPGDRPETLDYVRMAEVVKGVHCAVRAAAR